MKDVGPLLLCESEEDDTKDVIVEAFIVTRIDLKVIQSYIVRVMMIFAEVLQAKIKPGIKNFSFKGA